MSIRKELLSKLTSSALDSPWGHSPVEKWKSDSRAIWEGDISNFRRLRISGGTINPPDRPLELSEEPYPDEPFIRRITNSVALGKFLVKMQIHSFSSLGSLFRYVPEMETTKFRKFSCWNNLLSDIGIRMSYYSHRIKKLKLKNPVVLEIGAGYGALSAYLNGHYSSYFIVDLPENLILASEFLGSIGVKTGTIANYPSDDISVFLLSGADLTTVDGVDVVVNIMSMQHMSKKNLEYYFGEISRINPKYLYLVNRNIKRDPSDIEVQNYPVPSQYRIKTSAEIYSKFYTELVYSRD